MQGLVIKSTGMWYTVKTDKGMLQARLRGKLRTLDLDTTNPVAVGDIVEVDNDKDGAIAIKDITPRTNYIIRKSTKKSAQAHIIAANIDQALVVLSKKQPRVPLGFLDRFIVTAETFRIPITIVVNKIDLLKEKQLEKAVEELIPYHNLNYGIHFVSVLDNKGIDEIREVVLGKRTLITGQSGVGKSSFINALHPDFKLETSNISKHTEKGKHTTTFAEMHFINEQTQIIDTPGIKEIGLYGIEKNQLSHYYPEMRPLIQDCKFNNCTHYHEPNCAVIEAVRNGEIDIDRYERYLNILTDEDLD